MRSGVDRLTAQHPSSAAHGHHGVRPEGPANRHEKAVAPAFAEIGETGAPSQLATADHPSTIDQQDIEHRLFLLTQPIHEGVGVSIRESRTSRGHVDDGTRATFRRGEVRVNAL